MKYYENFLSYRRSETQLEVKNIFNSLQERGYSTFCDIMELGSGKFDDNLMEYIDCCTNFILVINQRSLERCVQEGDVLRQEIGRALAMRKNIVCVFVGAPFFPDSLPADIAEIRFQNGVQFDIKYYEEFIDDLVKRFLVDKGRLRVSDAQRDFIIRDDCLVAYVGDAGIVQIPENVKTIKAHAFKDKTKLDKVIFPQGLEVLEEGAFERCRGLTNVRLPGSMRSIGANAFSRCYNLAFVELGSGLEELGAGAFSYCCKLKWVAIPQGVRFVDPSAFNGCSLLRSIEVEEGNPFYSSAEGILYNGDKTAVIRCPENLDEDTVRLPDTVTTLGSWSFFRCLNVVDIVFPPRLERVEAFALQGSSNIDSITIPASVIQFDVSALEGWTSEQGIRFSRNLSPQIRYAIEQKILENDTHDPHALNCDFVIIKTTFESKEEAINMANMLLRTKLIVSGQISKLESIYLWENAVNDEEEFELSCITTSERCEEAKRFINANHSYEVGQILVLPIVDTSQEIAEWIRDGVRRKG